MSDSGGEQGCGFGLTLGCGHICRSLAGMRSGAVIAPHRGIGSVCLQRLDNAQMTPVRRAVQRREAIPAARVHVRAA